MKRVGSSFSAIKTLVHAGAGNAMRLLLAAIVEFGARPARRLQSVVDFYSLLATHYSPLTICDYEALSSVPQQTPPFNNTLMNRSEFDQLRVCIADYIYQRLGNRSSSSLDMAVSMCGLGTPTRVKPAIFPSRPRTESLSVCLPSQFA